MRRSLFAFLLVAFAALWSAPAHADPTADLIKMGTALGAVHSFHADIASADGPHMGIDYILPDKFHATMDKGMEVIYIGNDVWMKMGSSWMKPPVQGMMSPMKAQFDNARTGGLHGDLAKNYTITDEGSATVNGTATHKYHLVDNRDGHTVDMFIGPGHLPVQIQMPGKKGVSTVTYSKYDSVPDITPPM